MGFWSEMGKAVWNFDSVKNGFQTVSTIATIVPVYGNAVAVVCEGCGMVAGLIEQKEDWKSVVTQGVTGMGVALIPFGKIGKTGLSVVRAGTRAAEKEIVQLAMKEGSEQAAKLLVEQGGKKVLKEGVEAELKTAGKEMAEAIVEKKGIAQIPGLKPVLGGVSMAEMAVLRKQTAQQMVETLAKHGINISEEVIEKAIAGRVVRAGMVSDLFRLPAYVGTNLGVAFYNAVEAEKANPTSSVETVVAKCEELFKKNNVTAPEHKEVFIREMHKEVTAGGRKILDAAGKEVSADALVKQTLGTIPSQSAHSQSSGQEAANELVINRRELTAMLTENAKAKAPDGKLNAEDVAKIVKAQVEVEADLAAKGYKIIDEEKPVEKPEPGLLKAQPSASIQPGL